METIYDLYKRGEEIAAVVGGGRKLISINVLSESRVVLLFESLSPGENNVTFFCKPLDFTAPMVDVLRSVRNRLVRQPLQGINCN